MMHLYYCICEKQWGGVPEPLSLGQHRIRVAGEEHAAVRANMNISLQML